MPSKKLEWKPRKQFGEPASWAGHAREALNQEAGWAHQFADRWALVAAIPDGEDSSGRQKLRLPTPEELATRCSDIAAALWDEFEKRGWIVDVPSSEEAAEAHKKMIDEDRKNDRL